MIRNSSVAFWWFCLDFGRIRKALINPFGRCLVLKMNNFERKR